MDVTVAVDCMGGGFGPHVTVPAAFDYLQRSAGVNIILVGVEDVIAAELRRLKPATIARAEIRAAQSGSRIV